MRFGSKIRSVGFKEGERKQAHVKGGSPYSDSRESWSWALGKAWTCGSHYFNCSMLCGGLLHVNMVVRSTSSKIK